MMGWGIDCYDFFCLFVCEAAMTALNLGTLVATVRRAIVETIEPVSGSFFQMKNSVIV